MEKPTNEEEVTQDLRDTIQKVVSHATCATGDGFAVNSTANQNAEYHTQIEYCSIESSSGFPREKQLVVNFINCISS